MTTNTAAISSTATLLAAAGQFNQAPATTTTTVAELEQQQIQTNNNTDLIRIQQYQVGGADSEDNIVATDDVDKCEYVNSDEDDSNHGSRSGYSSSS